MLSSFKATLSLLSTCRWLGVLFYGMCLLLTMAWVFPLWPTAGNRLATISYWHLGYLPLPALQSEWMSFYPFFNVPKARLSASLSPVVGFLGLFSVSGCMLWLGFPAVDAAGSRIATHPPWVCGGISLSLVVVFFWCVSCLATTLARHAGCPSLVAVVSSVCSLTHLW